MIINFKEETPGGDIEFNGELKKDEVDFLLRYALMSLLAKGLLPQAIIARFPDDDEGPINPETLN